MQEVEIIQPDISDEENQERIAQIIRTINEIVFSPEYAKLNYGRQAINMINTWLRSTDDNRVGNLLFL